ncbi:hypothetical protein ZOSMA_271G00190 [Zostera marina]|uniref:Uncharacterized protein n=1 Tax=Zostera marina TaxID=29655 RepID=A0A0K9PE45_ZOSMR|nr:hypothetical protein ZOSMA_271G00190 [Zostera marina]
MKEFHNPKSNDKLFLVCTDSVLLVTCHSSCMTGTQQIFQDGFDSKYSSGLIVCMPVELEGYIRLGCTILTIFIFMPHLMWNKLSNDTVRYLHDFVKKPESLFFRRGNVHIHFNNTFFQILQDGTSLVNVKMDVQVPKLHYVYLVLFEAGKPIEIFVCGNNLFQPNFR